MREHEVPKSVPFSVWPNVAPNGFWPFTSNGLGEGQMKALRTEQEEVITEAQKLFDNWCARQHKNVESAWCLMDELRRHAGGPAAVVAWMHWYSSALQRLAEDSGDQLRFGCRAAKCCSAGMTAGMAASGSAELNQPQVT